MPTLPPVQPARSASGIIIDPNTLERKVPATRRADGTMRKELRIRPGFTPQEDVGLFRSRRQQTGERAPPGAAVPGAPAKRAVPPGTADAAGGGEAKSKAAKKNEKRKEKKREAKVEPVRDAWDEDDEPVKELKPQAAAEAKGKRADEEVERLAEELEKKAKV
ncbi:hypothetical protein CALVIDRAFT_540192 [Calocera viscosa TUFC12733]|uniref:WIBG Mago-binding domain-containing protein n=1 Tax=Calocera viscosa (strain TUFC12733) TaxID=1330018 RepID=A0A167J3D1_CALVF|nr:hypothetical protein CALVIDRAFT_540192 [Calocera viscosa TUFC12733]